ncbi:MAG: hypothetical protein QXY39_06890 [Thermofilaceae archaeon]
MTSKELETRLLDILLRGADIKQKSQDRDLRYVEKKAKYAVIIGRHLIRKNEEDIYEKTAIITEILLDAALDAVLFEKKPDIKKNLIADAITVGLILHHGIRSPAMLEEKWRESFTAEA